MTADRQEPPEDDPVDEVPEEPYTLLLDLPLSSDLNRIGEQLHALSRAQSTLQELLQAVVNITGELELPTVLRRIVRPAMDLVGARYGAMGVLDQEGRLLPSARTASCSTGTTRTSSAPWPVRPAWRSRSPASTNRSATAASSSNGCCCPACPTCGPFPPALPTARPAPRPPWAATGTTPCCVPCTTTRAPRPAPPSRGSTGSSTPPWTRRRSPRRCLPGSNPPTAPGNCAGPVLGTRRHCCCCPTGGSATWTANRGSFSGWHPTCPAPARRPSRRGLRPW